MNEPPVDLDAHRGMKAQEATRLRRTLSEAEATAIALRQQQCMIETELINVPAESWADAAAKARYVLNLYAASLGAQDSRHRDLVTSILNDFDRLNASSVD